MVNNGIYKQGENKTKNWKRKTNLNENDANANVIKLAE